MSTSPNTRRPVDLYRFEATLRGAAWTYVARAVAFAVTQFKARQTIRELSALTNGQLRDIGLRRDEIENAAARSSWSRS